MKRIVKISLALLSGLLIAASWPTNGFTPLIFIAFVPIIFLQDIIGNEEGKVKGSVFGLSFLTFLVWNSITTWWVWNSTPLGSVAMLLLNSAFMATTFWLYHFARKKIFNNKNGFFLLILFFLAFENLHLNWQLNWPWLNIGNVFSHNHSWIQWYEFTGVAGGTVWVLLSNILAYKTIKSFFDRQMSITKVQKVKSLLSFILIVIVPIIVSKMMYNSYEEKGEGVEVVVVQPNIDPYNEEFTLSASEIIERNFNEAKSLLTENTRFVVSPESSIHENIWLEKIDIYPSIKKLREFTSDNNVSYVIGASAFGMAHKDSKNDFAARKFFDADEYYYAYNSAFFINDSSDIQIHQKSRLTPGVEMMPSWWLLRPLKNLAIDLGGTVGTLKSEDKLTLFEHEDYRIAPMICYESVFGNYVADFVRNGSNLLFVITNDGWWGDTQGHKQHFEMSKLRAIENRRSVARSANTGISAFINQRGDVIDQTEYWEPAALRNTMNVNEELTFYSQYGDYLYRMGSFAAILVLVYSVVISILRKR